MASSRRSSDGGERSPHQSAGGIVKRSPVRHSMERERPRDPQAPIQRIVVRGGERRKWVMVRWCLYILIAIVLVGNVFLASWLYRSTENRGTRAWRFVWSGDHTRGFSPVLRFEPGERFRMLEEQGGLDEIRASHTFGIRPPRLAVVLGRTRKDPTSVLLLTVLKGLKDIGYHLRIYAVEDGGTLPNWKEFGGSISMLDRDSITDWSTFEGVILCSAEAVIAISSLMKEPFRSVPVVWIIQEDGLGEHISNYSTTEWDRIISGWRRAFNRAGVVVFTDFSLPLLYSRLDTGNFYVVPGSPVDEWVAENYTRFHSKFQLRKEHGIRQDDVVIVLVGSCFAYEDAPWDYAAVLQLLGSNLMQLSRTLDLGETFQVILLPGNSIAVDSFEERLAGRLYPDIIFKHYSLERDPHGALLMADIVIYGSMHEEQSFPSLLIRAMTFGVPIIAPDLPIIAKYVTNGVDGLLFHARDPSSLKNALQRAINGLGYEMESSTAISGKRKAKNMLTWDCVVVYAKLLENLLQFPSSSLLPRPAAEVQQRVWEWSLLDKGDREIWPERVSNSDDIVAEFDDPIITQNSDLSSAEIDGLDWAEVLEMELSQDAERRRSEEVNDRREISWESWEEASAPARRLSKMYFEAYERDEGELEQVGRHVRIYEAYEGAGTWPFLHPGALYRGLTLDKEGKDSRFGDIRAVDRLPLLNNSRYKELLCEFGGLLAVAMEVDRIHKTPWIGFQSWRATARKVSLSAEAVKMLTKRLRTDTKGDVFYFWAKLDLTQNNMLPDFWSACDILNNGHCRDIFQKSFRLMYDLPKKFNALPPMPATGHWSTLHSWVMPTPSFMEFILFSRMFLDALDASVDHCPLGSSTLENEHCFCRILELLVNVWAYHSARRMVHVDPLTGRMEEQHLFKSRKGQMWASFFNSSMLKEMDDDLAESVADCDPQRPSWIWPLTGEVYGRLSWEKDIETTYRVEKRRLYKVKEEQLRRIKHGRDQRPLI